MSRHIRAIRVRSLLSGQPVVEQIFARAKATLSMRPPSTP